NGRPAPRSRCPLRRATTLCRPSGRERNRMVRGPLSNRPRGPCAVRTSSSRAAVPQTWPARRTRDALVGLPALRSHALSQSVILFLTCPAPGEPPGPRCQWGPVRFRNTTPCAFPEPIPVLVPFTSGAMTSSQTLYLFKAARRPLYRKENLQLLAAERGS